MPLDRALWEQRLELAERHIVLAERMVASQEQVVAQLQRDGHPTQMARRILKAYKDLLELHIEDRDRLKKELASQTDQITGPLHALLPLFALGFRLLLSLAQEQQVLFQ